jgi:arylsulfatase A-like enzyme/Tfp pilus assembly protein PilF
MKAIHRASLTAGAVLLALTTAWVGWRVLRAPAPFDGPIVLVSIDTLRADHLPIYGYRGVETPAVDALAAGAVVFEQAWAHSPQTLPSHASLFTGRLPFEHGIRDNQGFALKKGETTLAGLLRARGFATGGFVSAYVMREETGIGQGFDVYDDELPRSSPEIAVGEVQRDGAATLAAAERWIGAQTSSRFFLFLHLYEPHTPYSPPDRFARFQPYDGEIAYDDELMGRLVDSLKRRNLYERSLVVLLSDHGEGLGDHGEAEHGLFLYRETVQVPLIIKLPGGAGAGRRVGDPVQHIDLLPTILDLAGAPAPAGLRGRFLAPAFRGERFAEQGLYAEALYSRYHFGWSELYALTDARYRFIRAPRDELYDQREDPGERRNLAGEREQTRVAMRQALDRLLAGTAVGAPAEVSADARERLRALGYVGMQATVDSQRSLDVLPDPKDKVRVLEQYRQALDAVRRGEFDPAIASLRAIVDENPAMADVWNEMAGLLVRQGRLKEAAAAYRRLVEIAPHDPSAVVNVAQVLLQSGDLDGARAQAELALSLLPGSELRWREHACDVLMRVALVRGDSAAARAAAERALASGSSSVLPPYVEALIRYNAGQFAEALPFLQETIRLSETRTFPTEDLHRLMGDTLGRLDRYAEAEQQFNAELRVFPYNLRARAGLAMLYRAQGRTADADRAIETMLRLSPTPAGVALAAQLWTMFGEPEKAEAARRWRSAAAERR